MQRPPAGQRREKQASRFQRPMNLRERTGKIVDPVKAHIADDKIETVRRAFKFLLLAREIGAARFSVLTEMSGKRRINPADIKHGLEIAFNIGEPFDQKFGGFPEQRVMRFKPRCRPRAMPLHELTIKNTNLAWAVHWGMVGKVVSCRTYRLRKRQTMTFSPATASRFKNIAVKALDLILPPACLSCDRPVGMDRTLCPACWNGIHFIAKPFCARCGAPFEFPVEDGTLCGGCIAQPPHFGAARAAMLYDDFSRSLVLRFKHGDRIHTARALASWMYRAGEEFRDDTDMIVPVPLHRWRLFQRRYNQAALLAQNLASLGGKPFVPDVLIRERPTPSQGNLSRKERQANVKGAFGINPKHRKSLEGRSILLIDDVLTTGATVNECTALLLDSGAKAVNVLVLARVKGSL